MDVLMRWLALSLLLLVSACSFETRSSDFECAGVGDCPEGRECAEGFCIVVEDIPVECPAGCDSCDGDTCVIDCSAPGACAEQVLCPGTLRCRVECTGSDSCSAGVVCGSACGCDVLCDGTGSCSGQAECTRPQCEDGMGCTTSGPGVCDRCL